VIVRVGDSLREFPVLLAGPRRKKWPPAERAAFSCRRPGISLLEVLLALAIFLLALVAIGQLVDLGIDHALDSQAQATATRLAQSKLAEVEAGVIPLDGSSPSGTFDVETEWSWNVSSTQANIPNLYTVTVQVSRQFRNRQFQVTMTQLVFDPNMMGNAQEAQKPQTTSSSGTTSGSGTGGTGQ
jgi:general secretion pathway protein I